MSGGPVLRAPGSHLYPGARGSIEGTLPGAGTACLIESADGSATIGSVRLEGQGFLLSTEPYITARGTRIPAKRWRIVADGGAFGVKARA